MGRLGLILAFLTGWAVAHAGESVPNLRGEWTWGREGRVHLYSVSEDQNVIGKDLARFFDPQLRKNKYIAVFGGDFTKAYVVTVGRNESGAPHLSFWRSSEDETKPEDYRVYLVETRHEDSLILSNANESIELSRLTP